MKRYRGIISIKFKNGNERNLEEIILANNLEEARKKFTIEINGSYKNNERCEKFKVLSLKEDTSIKPSFNFLKESLLDLNDLSKDKKEKETIKDNLYKALYSYTPNFDDDNLSDILSYCESGHLDNLINNTKKVYKGDGLTKLIDDLLNDLDSEWVCYYNPLESLEEQYLKAIS